MLFCFTCFTGTCCECKSKNCSNLNYEALANPIPVSVASLQVKLQAVGIVQISIHWGPGAEIVFKMLVIPNLTWPILVCESHLHQTDALVDHGAPSPPKHEFYCRV